MATYLYGCLCGHKEEKKHGMTEKPEYKCPVCGGKMEKYLTSDYIGILNQWFDGNSHEL